MIDEFITSYVTAATEDFPEEWDLDALWTALRTVYPVGIRYQDLEREAGGRDGLDRETLIDDLKADAQKAYDAREAEIGADKMRELERQVLLSVLDRKWREHLYEMDYLREGIGLRAYSQRDPLVEYQREGFDMFNAMKEGIREETVGFLFNLEVQVDEEEDEDERRGPARLRAAGGSRHQRRLGNPGRLRVAAGNGARPRARPRAAHPRQGSAGAAGAAAPQLLRARASRARWRSSGTPSPTPTTRSPGSAATRCARAARARSTRSATVRPEADPPASPPAPAAERARSLTGFRGSAVAGLRTSPRRSAELEGGAGPAVLDQLEPGGDRPRALAAADVDADLGSARARGRRGGCSAPGCAAGGCGGRWGWCGGAGPTRWHRSA